MNYKIKKVRKGKKTMWETLRPDGKPAQPAFETKREAKELREKLQTHWMRYWRS